MLAYTSYFSNHQNKWWDKKTAVVNDMPSFRFPKAFKQTTVPGKKEQSM
jgi:hypothetical protein